MRTFWRIAYPFCIIFHKLFGLSYKWVNVGFGAWHRNQFDPLWHHRWYGDEISSIPDAVNLCGIKYVVSVYLRGMRVVIRFSSDDGHTIFKLSCDLQAPHSLWYCDSTTHVAVKHLTQAHQWVEAWRPTMIITVLNTIGDDDGHIARRTTGNGKNVARIAGN